MTIQEIRKTLIEQPEIITLLREYEKAKKRNPQKTAQALPVIIKLLTIGKTGETSHEKRF